MVASHPQDIIPLNQFVNALKNILELLMEDAAYIEYFAVCLNSKSHKTKSPPPRMKLKTQGHDPEDKKQYESYSKIHYGPTKKEVHYSKINLNKSMKNNELQEAKKKLARLQNKYTAIM